MIEADHRSRTSRSPSAAQLQRDAALVRLGRVRRGVIVSAAGLTAAIAALVSALAPGRSSAARLSSATASAARAQGGGHTMPPLATPSELGLQGPGQPPQSVASEPQPPAPQPQSAAAPSGGDSSSGPSGGVVSGGS